jgi:hypothetical protein
MAWWRALLFLNELIPADAVIDASSLPKVTMPARDHFIARHAWTAEAP